MNLTGLQFNYVLSILIFYVIIHLSVCNSVGSGIVNVTDTEKTKVGILDVSQVTDINFFYLTIFFKSKTSM